MRAERPDDSGMVKRRGCCSPQFDWLKLTLVTHHQVIDQCCRTVVKVMWIILWCRRCFYFYVVVCFVWILHFAVQEKKNVAHWIGNNVGATVTITVAVCSSGISPEYRWAGTKAVCIFRVQLLLWFCCISLHLLCVKKCKHSGIRISL